MTAWSSYQLAIFNFLSEGRRHGVVEACPGSGKTTTIVEGTKYIPSHESVLMVAFNVDIVDTLKAKVGRGIQVSTLHSFGFRACLKHFGKLSVEKQKVRRILLQLLPPAKFGDDRLDPVRKAAAKAVSLAKSCLVSSVEELEQMLEDRALDVTKKPEHRAGFLRLVMRALEICRKPEGTIDLDDMIWIPASQNIPVQTFHRVIVDEAQDLNRAQMVLIKKACRKDGRILAVGDKRQAIYGFRGAGSDSMGDLVRELDAQVLPLSVSYRCSKAVIREAQTIVPSVEWGPHAPEGKVEGITVEKVLKEATAGDFILSRVNAPLISLCMSLLVAGKRASIQGRDFGEDLIRFIEKSKAQTISELLEYVETWKQGELERLGKLEKDTTLVEDRAACLEALTEGEQSLAAVVAKIQGLFSDTDDLGRIVLSSTHKAKGLERERVFLLRKTFLNPPPKDRKVPLTYWIEEQNLYYVAVTRAKRDLYLVTDLPGKKS